ncbi:Putative ribosome biogenesis GTPase RsgA [Legionella pneumophila]|uniref:small ribosomal subunit biogenesis GTPase RsgA n=1 Tax=Legionella pneumophila TaxID=446 RepID=UPI00058D344D|nr:small ribosomal subunit biogenesis GTPase RsgA [Legionella pneumophila]HAT9273705.1 small ribosomal subunit biogenesis GTPase RsgA [Legionella pneumophila subsp. pneumophila]MCO1452038.1 small ribosomal subunit biogenesis GTPase RsgA [Legionella pneumophila]MCW8458739.1 small ribosomal subunit biogenesis GTPase RsgA [Legionella pneumophila]MCZ4723345.1 small ribosomal subunit biogenesis GTPase RsgA [Legionella pneumophila]MCZ4730179.1 small ribosomal subunit biogenesis GTPase RsgA [Legionel
MSKRRINKQQSARIAKIQKNYHESMGNNSDNLADGLVITRFSRHAEIEDNQGKRIRCSIRPNLDTLVAGDRVIWQIEGEKQGVVVSIYPRGSLLARPGQKGLKKPVAANITQLVVVIAPKPEISWPLLDSYLIMAEILQLHVVIVLNKIDLPCQTLQQRLMTDYQLLNYPVIMASNQTPDTIVPLKQALNNQISVFVGQSGVGKSSLISSLLPHEENIAIDKISMVSELGKHTTRNSRYYHLPSGGALIDSPGVREFSLWDIDCSMIAQGYKEFKPYLSQCKFRNCTHIDTPQCAIIDALNKGKISTQRYENFTKLCAQFNSLKE